jgi:hypothetical protein
LLVFRGSVARSASGRDPTDRLGRANFGCPRLLRDAIAAAYLLAEPAGGASVIVLDR